MLFEMHVHVGMLRGERSQRARQELDDRRNVGEHAHVAARARGMPAHLVIELRRLMQEHPCARQQSVAGCSQLDAFGAAHEERRAEALFQIGDALADRRGDGVRALRRARNAARIGDGHEQFQIAQIESQGSLLGELPACRRSDA